MNVLKRNQACHQCRKRKLKCDAKRPCSTCVRSHAHAVAHAPAGTEVPPQPDCTFDDVPESTPAVAEGPKSRYERLENRINELEALLYQKEQGSDQSVNSPPFFQSSLNSLDNPNVDPNLSLPQGKSPQIHSTNFSILPTGTRLSSDGGVDLFADQSFCYTEVREDTTAPPPSPGLDVVWPNWPVNVPRPDMLRHLVELFFAFHPHASRLFHAPSFMASLLLPPTHPKFPIPPVLHAICAASTLYTAAVSSPPLPNYAEVALNEIFQQKYRAGDARPDSFAEEQARWARETIDKYLFMGENLIQVLQGD